MYRDAYPGEADAIAVYATTLAAAGHLDPALAAAADARNLAEGEDTLAGLGKIYAWRGDLPRAIELYTQSVARAGDTRRPIRRAALALLQWANGDDDAARATVAPCLPGGADAHVRERGACLFVAGVIDPHQADAAARELDALAADATDLHPAYGQPASLAALVRARAHFFAGGCLRRDPDPQPPLPAAAELDAAYAAPRDFYATYHVPFFLTYADCEAAALAAARGDRARAVRLLAPHARPGRWWLDDDLAAYRQP